VQNRDLAIGEAYWQRTIYEQFDLLSHGMGTEGGPDEPLKVKTYRGLPRYRLPPGLPPAIGDPRWAFEEFRRNREGGPLASRLDPRLLSNLLYYSYGLSRVDMGPRAARPYHRHVASARCFFPTELYISVAGAGDPAVGLYHYDQLHHGLTRLRDGDQVERLGNAIGADLGDALGVVVLTSDFWKTAFVYRHYAYRLCTQEAGMVAGNILLVAGALGLTGEIHHQFLDEPVRRLLGLPPVWERPLVVIPLYPAGRAGHPRWHAPPPDAGLLDRIEPIAPQHLDERVDKDTRLWSMLVEFDQSCVLESGAELKPCGPPWPHPPYPSAAPPVALPPDRTAHPDLAAALRRRSSGGRLFAPAPEPIALADLARVLRYALAAHRCDLYPPGTPPLVDCYPVVQRVDGLDPGVYRLAADGTALYPVCSGTATGPVDVRPSVRFPLANAIVYLVGDVGAALARFGNRSYRVLSQEAGIVAQRISTFAGAVSLAARITNSYQAEAAKDLLGLSGTTQVPIFQITIGRRRVTSQYEMPIVF
jgi:SagB-type dehydrogenase family enzyme